MMQRMKEILLVAPYQKMYDLACSIVAEKKYDDVEIVVGDLEEGRHIAEQALEGSTKIIISRGGTYQAIRRTLEIPVVEIRSSIYDTIETLSQVIKQPVPLAVIGFSNILYGYDLDFLQTILKEKVRKIDLHPNEDVEKVVAECAADGFTAFLGDTVVQKACEHLGYKCYLQESGYNAVLSAMQEAHRILRASKQEIELAKRLRAVIDFVHDGVIATDNQGTVIICNAIAQDLLDIRREDVLGTHIHEMAASLPALAGITTGERIIDRVVTLKGAVFSVSNIPVAGEGESFGSVIVVRDVKELQDYEKKMRLIMADKGFVARHTFDSIIYESPEMTHCIAIAKKFSQYDASVLIEGGSGVGKELFAQSIHNESLRHSGPFVAVNCATLPKSLIESELFGYVEGAFTGSRKGGKAGFFEMAHKGTLFLDEIGELPLDVQGQLLRVIQEKEIMRLGDTKILPVDVRLICATNRDLSEMVREGVFRKDILYRINTLSLYIPPLSKRPADIMVLAHYFLEIFCRKYSKSISGFSPRATAYLQAYPYEGNVRELRGMMERSVIICDGELVRLSDLQDGRAITQAGKVSAKSEPFQELSLEKLEKDYVREVYAGTGNSIAETMRILGISRTTLWRKLKETM